MAYRRVGFAVLLYVWGCGGTAQPGSDRDRLSPGTGGTGQGGAGGSGGTSGTAGAGGVAGATVTLWDGVAPDQIPTAEVLCAQKEKVILEPCTWAQNAELLVGRWSLCSGESPVPNPDAVGMEFASGGIWYGLIRGSAGGIERDSGFDGQGHWEFIQNSTVGCSPQLDIELSSGGIPAFPVFSDEPRKVLLGTGGDAAQPRFAAIP